MLMDSITQVAVFDEGALVVSGSHGGTSSGKFALDVPLRMAFFNDAGVGKDDVLHRGAVRSEIDAASGAHSVALGEQGVGAVDHHVRHEVVAVRKTADRSLECGRRVDARHDGRGPHHQRGA